MKKVLNFTLASLALAALTSPAHAQFGGSVRGDVGMLGNQVPYLMVQTGIAPVSPVNTWTTLSHRKDGLWDFTGRLFVYTSCAPCPTYIAASWQGSNHKVNSCHDLVEVDGEGAEAIFALIPLRVVNLNTAVEGIVTGIDTDTPIAARVGVKNKFSKAKLGVGFDLIKTCCFGFTMEVGGNYLDAQLNTDKKYTLTQLNAQNCITVPPGVSLCSPDLIDLPFDFVIRDEAQQKTEGVGLYASFKAEYKFPASCLGNCFGIYGKAEVADIIGRQKYRDRVCYENSFEFIESVLTPIVPPDLYEYEEHVCNRYNNIVEVDLELALVYSPCFKCWENLNLNFALGVRTDSFVNLFSKPVEYTNVSYLSLTRPTVFLEVGIKV